MSDPWTDEIALKIEFSAAEVCAIQYAILAQIRHVEKVKDSYFSDDAALAKTRRENTLNDLMTSAFKLGLQQWQIDGYKTNG